MAPTDVDLATFVTELNRVRFFDKVAMEFAKDLRRQGRIMRHFKLAFAVGLTANAGS